MGGNTKITWEIARQVRQHLAEGRRQADIAADFGISVPRVSEIANGHAWKEAGATSLRRHRAAPKGDDRIRITESGCWESTLHSEVRGYRKVVIGGKRYSSHRLAWALKSGRFPEKHEDVHHTCENRACFNPDHLELVPHDKHHRDHIRALTKDQVAAIRAEYAYGATGSALAIKYGVTDTTIYHVVNRQTWRWVN